MKKSIFFIFLFLFCIKGISQEFMGIKPDSTKEYVIKSFISKGLTLVNINEKYTLLKGKLNNNNIEVYIICTPTTNKVWKIGVYFDEQYDWISIKNQYNSLLSILTDKYGKPTDSFHFFLSPSYEGDGHEMLDISLEKCNYASFFRKNDFIISVLITQFKQVEIEYENEIISKIDDIERTEKLKSSL